MRLGRLSAPLVFAALVAVDAAPARAAEPVSVVASFTILADMVGRIGGERVSVTSLVGPNGDAHVYQPTPADAETVAGADLVVVNGLGFEGFLDRILAAAEYRGPVVTAAAAIHPIEGGDQHADEHGDDHDADADDHADDHAEEGHGHAAEHVDDHGDVDPHAWQDPANAIAYTRAIEDGLCGVDPDGCTTYRANGSAYRDEIAALDADIRSRVGAIPPERRMVITGHDAFRYFGEAYGVTFLAPQGVSTESEASARDVAALIEQIRKTGVRTVFVEAISDPRLIERIAAETGASLGGSLHSDALSPPGEGADSYLAMMRSNADALIAAMQQGS